MRTPRHLPTSTDWPQAREKRLQKRREEIRDELLEQVDDERRIGGRYASVDRSSRTCCSVKSEEVVFETLDHEGIDRDLVVFSIDTSILRERVDKNKIDEDAIFEVEQRPYVRLSGVKLEEDT